jgi:hypothetical protein
VYSLVVVVVVVFVVVDVVGGVPPLFRDLVIRSNKQNGEREERREREAYPIMEVTDGSCFEVPLLVDSIT